MIKNRKCYKFIEDNRGVALITTLIISVVVTVFALSLLLVAYTLFTSVNSDNMNLPAVEAVNSVADELTEELLVPSEKYMGQDGKDLMMEDRNQGNQYVFYFYMYDRYAALINAMDEDPAAVPEKTMYFALDSDDRLGDIVVEMTWVLSSDSESGENELHMTVKNHYRDAECKVERILVFDMDDEENAPMIYQ